MLRRKQKNQRPFILFISLMWVVLWGCRPQNPVAQFTDDRVESRRIISTMPSTTEMLYEFGVWEQVVAVSTHCQIPSGQAPKPIIGTGFDPDIEQVLGLEADLVVGSIVQQNAPFITELERLEIPYLLVSDQTIEDLLQDMPRLGQAVGAVIEAEDVVSRIRSGLDEITASTGDLWPLPVLVVYGQGPIYAAGPESFMGPILRAAGGRNVLTEGAWVELDIEAVISLSPAVILVPTELSDVALQESWRSYEQIPAVREGRVYPVRSFSAHHPGPGLVEVAQEIAVLLNRVRGRLAPNRERQEGVSIDGR